MDSPNLDKGFDSYNRVFTNLSSEAPANFLTFHKKVNLTNFLTFHKNINLTIFSYFS